MTSNPKKKRNVLVLEDEAFIAMMLQDELEALSRRQGSRRSPQHHPRSPAALRARTQPNRKRLGISARQQARDYRIRQLRRHPRQGMRRLDILRQRPKPHRVHHNPIM